MGRDKLHKAVVVKQKKECMMECFPLLKLISSTCVNFLFKCIYRNICNKELYQLQEEVRSTSEHTYNPVEGRSNSVPK